LGNEGILEGLVSAGPNAKWRAQMETNKANWFSAAPLFRSATTTNWGKPKTLSANSKVFEKNWKNEANEFSYYLKWNIFKFVEKCCELPKRMLTVQRNFS
jgi:pyocin large subunit-like protein